MSRGLCVATFWLLSLAPVMCRKQDSTEQVNLAIIFYDILVKCLARISTEISPVLSQFLRIYP